MQENTFLDWHRAPGVANLCQILERTARNNPETLFCANEEIRFSYADTLAAVQGFAQVFAARIKGADVAIFMPNSLAALITYYGVLWAGGVPALLNAALPAKTGADLLDSLAPGFVFADRPLDFAPDAEVVGKASLAEWRDLKITFPSACGSGNDPATSFFTGGTTGVPKRVCYSHEMLLCAGERMQWGWPMRAGEVFLHLAPFSHIYGYIMGVCVTVQVAGTAIIPPRFHPREALELMERERVTVLGGGPPAIYQALMSDPSLKTRDLSTLRVCPGGGAPFPQAVHARWKRLTGLAIYEGYGMTEIAPITVNTIVHGARAGAAGKPVPDTLVEVVDVDTGTRKMPTGEAGEIRTRGPHGMRGYVANPEETAKAIRDGWIYTGDIGTLDAEGFLTITDRKKDVIIHKGFNVFPREVEETLMRHEVVTGACVVGAPDKQAGECIIAYVTCAEPVDPEVLIAHCRAYLVAHRLPARVEILPELPLTPAGKVDRIALRVAAKQLKQEVK